MYRQAFVVICLLVTLRCSAQFEQSIRPCNGLPELCYLKVNQITFPGSHNSGSGFDGPLRRCDGMDEFPCIWQNLNTSIYNQLELGIRFLSIDACFLPANCVDDVYDSESVANSRLFACRGSETDITFNGFRYGGPIISVFKQIDEWMESHPREVIGIHFTQNIPMDERAEVFTELVRILENMWGANSTMNSSTVMNSYFQTVNETWPTLLQAIDSNQRIFVFFDEELIVNIIPKIWIYPTPFSTFNLTAWTSNCDQPIFTHADRCFSNREFIIEAGYTLGLCIYNGQESCNVLLQNASMKCYDRRMRDNRTVNVLSVDYPEQAMDPNSVFEVSKILNYMNIDFYLNFRFGDTDFNMTTDNIVRTGTPLNNYSNRAVVSHYSLMIMLLAVKITF